MNVRTSIADGQLTVKDLMAAVGYFLLFWGLLEVELNKQISLLRQAMKIPSEDLPLDFSKRLEEWRRLTCRTRADPDALEAINLTAAEIDALRLHRNTIVHGLCAANAQPNAGQPKISCLVAGYGSQSAITKIYTKDDLEALAQSVDYCRRAIR